MAGPSTSKRAAEFMKKSHSAGKPFYIQISSYALHDSGNALPETIEKYKKLMGDAKGQEVSRAAIMENLDTAIGQVLRELHRTGQDRDTLVLFASDNGGERFSYNWPFTGEKASVNEGGIRIPMILS